MNDRRKSANDFQKQNQAKRLKNTYKSDPFSPFQTLKPAYFLAFEVERLIVAKMLQTDRKRPFSQISVMRPKVRGFYWLAEPHFNPLRCNYHYILFVLRKQAGCFKVGAPNGFLRPESTQKISRLRHNRGPGRLLAAAKYHEKKQDASKSGPRMILD